MTAAQRFAAMGTTVTVAGAAPHELAAVRALFAAWEARFSRFDAAGELCAINAAPGPVVAVSPEMAAALEVALDAAQLTGGLVVPTLLDALEHAGYDADFAALPADRAAAPGPPPRSVPGALRLHGGLLLERPPGLRLDLAGVVKGMAVDAALALVRGPGHVAAGGDLAAHGPLEVALPGGGQVRLLDGALATSSTAARRWRRGGAEQHHLIDPRTARPAQTRWATVTVCAATCAGADVAAKAALLLDADGPAWLDAHDLPGRLVDGDGAVTLSAAWRAQAGPAAAAELTACT